MAEAAYMKRALALAERGRGWVEPNPLVGAVVVRDGAIVGEGWHERFGEAHAEVNALRQAGEKACGADLYVTLEPCCHFGKTPPCTDAVIAAGIRRVVMAMVDPVPHVGGQGLAQLRSAGVAVEVGLAEADARRLNAPYLKRVQTGRPWVHAKWAMSLDGKIAARTGESQWITGPEARARVHELRGRMDAIIIGAGTLRTDDPLLTARPPGPRTPVRIILTTRGQGFPDRCRLLDTLEDAPVRVFYSGDADGALTSWGTRGVRLTRLAPTDAGRVNLRSVLTELGREGMTNVLVEGGGTTLGWFHDLGEIDEVHAFVAPLVIGGRAASSPVEGDGIARLAEALALEEMAVEALGCDVYLHSFRRTG